MGLSPGTPAAHPYPKSWLVNPPPPVITLYGIKLLKICICSALYEDSPVVVDGNMITSRIPQDLPEFCKAIIAQLKQ